MDETVINTWEKSKNLKRLKTKSDDICLAFSRKSNKQRLHKFLEYFTWFVW